MRVLESRALLLLLLCLAGSIHIVSAQVKTQAPGEVVRVNTDLVQTHVTVVDRQNRFVDGLSQDQFELRVDGKAAPIVFFDRVKSNPTEAQSVKVAYPGVSTAAVAGRRIIFFVDDVHLGAESIDPVRKGLLHFIDHEMLPGDEVMIASASGQLGFLQQFSEHPSVLRAAVARINRRPNPVQDTENVAISEYVAYKIASGDAEAMTYYSNELLRSLQFIYALPKYGGKGSGFLVGSEGDQAQRMVMQRAQAIVGQSIPNSLVSLTALETFIRSSASLPGRKIAFFISDGFLLHHRNGELADKLQRVNDAATRAGSVIYAVDARAFTGRHQVGRMRMDQAAEKFNAGETEAFQSALTQLSEGTGGRALLEAPSLPTALGEALAESLNYYVVAWRPEREEQKVAKFKNVDINVVGRPELVVRLARSYLASPTLTDSGVSTPKPEATRILPTSLALSFLDTPKNGPVLTASTQIGTEAAVFANATEPAQLDVAGVILDDSGKLKSSFKTRLTVDPLSGRPADGSHVIYNYRASLAPGIYQVRVAAEHKQTGLVGRATEWIEIPNLAVDTLKLSSLLLDGREIQSGNEKVSIQTPVIQHSVARRFSPRSRLDFMLFVYGAQAAGSRPQLVANARVLRERRTVMTLRPATIPVDAATDLQRIPYGASIPLNSLGAGKYLLEVTVTDGKTNKSASQQIDFEIR